MSLHLTPPNSRCLPNIDAILGQCRLSPYQAWNLQPDSPAEPAYRLVAQPPIVILRIMQMVEATSWKTAGNSERKQSVLRLGESMNPMRSLELQLREDRSFANGGARDLGSDRRNQP